MNKIQWLLVSASLMASSVSAQQVRTYRQPIEDHLVPAVVRTNFKTQYPRAPISIWYISHITYWYEDYALAWYGDWNIPQTTVVYTFEYPAYYIVEFYRNDENSRAIYNRYGHWFETRTKVPVLPEPVAEALKKAGYGAWGWSKHKERIESPGMEGSVYRLQVSNGNENRILRISGQGEIVQVRYD